MCALKFVADASVQHHSGAGNGEHQHPFRPAANVWPVAKAVVEAGVGGTLPGPVQHTQKQNQATLCAPFDGGEDDGGETREGISLRVEKPSAWATVFQYFRDVKEKQWPNLFRHLCFEAIQML